MPARGEPEAIADPADRAAAREADHPVGSERRAADHVDDRSTADERATGSRGRRIGGHAAGILPQGWIRRACGEARDAGAIIPPLPRLPARDARASALGPDLRTHHPTDL